MMVVPVGQELADIPGLCGIVEGSILPGLLRPRGRTIGRGRHLQLVRELYPAGRPQGRLPRGTVGGHRQTGPRRVRPAGPGLEQRQPHHPGRPAPDRPAARADAVHHAGGDLPDAHRGHGVRRPDHHQPLRGVRRESGADRQLRRHRGKKSAGHADLRRCDRPAHEDLPVGADLRAGRRHRRRRRRRRLSRIIPRRRRP